MTCFWVQHWVQKHRAQILMEKEEKLPKLKNRTGCRKCHPMGHKNLTSLPKVRSAIFISKRILFSVIQ